MSRVGLVVAALAAVLSISLAGCAALPDWMSPSMPSWLSPTPAGPVLQTLRFESRPAGADVRTAQGQNCQTPCALAVPSESQSIVFAKNGFLPQTVQINVGAAPDHAFYESPPPALVPNPVVVELQPVPPPARTKQRPRHRAAASTHPASNRAAQPAPRVAAAPSPQDSAFPPVQPSASPFPPPPPTR